jgi:dTDP-4-amino-4,6-dideoxygalactose transaminase
MSLIKQADPGASYLANRGEIDAAIVRVMESGWYLVGAELARFENHFAHRCGAKHAVGVANGTDAIELALRAIGVGHGDYVLTTALTAVASATGIIRTGASPIFVDINTETCSMSPQALEKTLERCYRERNMPKAILLVHLYGQPASPMEVMEVANRFGLKVIEDCAQAHDAKASDRKVSSFGDASAFSFYPTKNLGTLGDAGAVVTSDDDIAQRVREMRQYGWNDARTSIRYGVNSRMDEIHAAVLNVKLNHFEKATARRIEIASHYDQALEGHEILRKLSIIPGNRHVYHQYVVRVTDRESIKNLLLRQNIATAIHYSLPIHEHPFFADFRSLSLDLTEAELASREVLSLPMYPELVDTDIKRVISACLDLKAGA